MPYLLGFASLPAAVAALLVLMVVVQVLVPALLLPVPVVRMPASVAVPGDRPLRRLAEGVAETFFLAGSLRKLSCFFLRLWTLQSLPHCTLE